jgi:hypothetical protein
MKLHISRLVFLLIVAFNAHPLFAAGGTCPATVPSGVTSCFYVDIASGLDTNNGTSEGSAWAHLPGMPTCTKTCSSTTPAPGEGFILKGGGSWPNANFPIKWTWSGSSGSPIYIGVDQTWYSGSSWAQPIFDAGSAAIPGSYNEFIRMLSQTYVTIDNLNMQNFYWDGAGSFGALNYIVVSGGNYITLNHLYLHAWTHHASSDGTTDENCMIVLGDSNPPYESNSIFENGVIQNSDGDNDSCYGFYSWSNLENSVIHDIPNGALFSSANPKTISGNLIYNITKSFGGVHANALETVGSGTVYVYNNVIHDLALGESLMIGNSNETDYVWNNLFYNLGGGGDSVGPEFPQSNGFTGMSIYLWNNTVVTGNGNSCFIWVSGFTGSFNTVAIQNNHCITTGSVNNTGFTVATYTASNNVLQTPTVAAGQGYTASETYAYSPAGAAASTIGAGTAICGVAETCTGNFAALAKDTSYACTQQTVSGVVESVCPNRKVLSRPSTGSWNAGAYQGQVPAPPIGVTGVPVAN